MIFRDTLEQTLHNRPALRFAPPPSVLGGVAELLLERHGDGDGPRKSPAELAALLERLRLARFDWDNIRAADRFDIAWVLWDGPEPPAEHEAFLTAYLHWVETPWRRFQIRRIACAWVDGFDPRLVSIRSVGAWLAARASQLLDPWPWLGEELDIFSVESAPTGLAESFLAADESEQACVDRLGFGDTVASGLRLETLGAAAALVRRRLAKRPGLAARLMELSLHQPAFRPGAGAEQRGSRAHAIRVMLAEALLLPWQREDPAEDVTEQILFYLLREYGDPWLRDTIWGDMQPLATGIARDWCKRKAIAAFFRLAGRRRGDNRTQTQLRQEFWTAYVDRIDEAWLVGGPQSFAALGIPEAGYGRLVGCRPEHCALLLRIGGMTIVETSEAHNEHLWLAGNELAPPLYHEQRRSYCPSMLTAGADFSSGYSCNDGANWQERLHSFIERHTGISRPKS
jgi:hypothetical protein